LELDDTTSQDTLAVFGATGSTGRHVVAHALTRGYKVRALARSPGKVAVTDSNLTVIKGDFEDMDALKRTVQGASYVICCAGGASGKAYETGMMIAFITRLWPLLEAEPALKVFLFQSVIFAPKADGSLPVLLKLLGPIAAYINGNTEMLRDNTAVTKFIAANASDRFDFIVTRPGSIAEKPGGPRLAADQNKASLSTITFAKLGAFTVDALTDDTLYGTCPFVVPRP
jgi:hypothetical protein